MQEVWVRILGLPLHLWSVEVFRKLGNECGGFVSVDVDTSNHTNLQWAEVLVKNDGRRMPRVLHLVVSNLCFSVQLWWEVSPWLKLGSGQLGRERGDGGTRAIL